MNCMFNCTSSKFLPFEKLNFINLNGQNNTYSMYNTLLVFENYKFGQRSSNIMVYFTED